MSRLVAIISLLANLREETCPQMCSLVENVTPIPCCSVCMIPCCSVSMICTSPVCLKKACCSALQCVAVRYTVCCSASQCVAVCKTWLPTQTGHVNWSCHTFSSVNMYLRHVISQHVLEACRCDMTHQSLEPLERQSLERQSLWASISWVSRLLQLTFVTKTHICHRCEFWSQMWRSHVPRVNESCPAYAWAMSHMWISNVSHVIESCRTWESCRTCEWVMPHVWVSHVAHVNESCHTCEILCHTCERLPDPHPPSLSLHLSLLLLLFAAVLYEGHYAKDAVVQSSWFAPPT